MVVVFVEVEVGVVGSEEDEVLVGMRSVKAERK
jgi:fructose/tagatose bisphosphate aldolase